MNNLTNIFLNDKPNEIPNNLHKLVLSSMAESNIYLL